jgi:DNA-binding beta-propeller fold protein YncE
MGSQPAQPSTSSNFASAPAGTAAPAADRNASQQMQSPVLGFVYAAGGEVRTIQGIPGASTLSDPLALPDGVTSIEFAPGQQFAVFEQTNGASIGVITFSSVGTGPLIPIPGGISQPDIISFSPNGTAVALYSASEGRLQVIGGLPNQPQLNREMSSSELPGAVRLLALADDGVTLLEGTADSAVYLLAGSGPQLLESVSDLGGMVFTPKSNDALIFDRDGSTLSLLQGVSGVRSSRQLASGLAGLEGTIGLQTDGSRAIVTSANTNHLWQIDLQSLQVQDVQLPTEPAMLQPLRVSGQYLLSWQSGRPAWILDTSQEKGAVYFVPALVQPPQRPTVP